ncbi:KR domain-containing protein [Bacillus velezensis]
MAPKVKGLINLDEAAKDMRLDFFILFSSLAGGMGNPGQARLCGSQRIYGRICSPPKPSRAGQQAERADPVRQLAALGRRRYARGQRDRTADV